MPAVFAVPTAIEQLRIPKQIPPAAEAWAPDHERAKQLLKRSEAWLQQQPNKALELLREAMAADTETNPAERPYYALRSAIFFELGNSGPRQAIDFYNQGLQATRVGDFELARSCYDKALAIDSGLLWAANNRAWLGATHVNPRARNDPDVVTYALYACIESNWRNWSFVDTLSAAYAERGDFPAAIRCAERAASLAPPKYQEELREAIRGYQMGLPRRQQQPSPAPNKVADVADDEDPFVADNDEERTKQKHREIYLDFLTRQGYRPEVDEDKDVSFKKEGGSYFISVSDDPNFFKLVYPGFFKIESAEQQFRALRAIERVGREVKVVKLIIIRDHVWAMAESFVPDQSAAPEIFEDSLLAIRVGVQLFAELMDETP